MRLFGRKELSGWVGDRCDSEHCCSPRVRAWGTAGHPQTCHLAYQEARDREAGDLRDCGLWFWIIVWQQARCLVKLLKGGAVSHPVRIAGLRPGEGASSPALSYAVPSYSATMPPGHAGPARPACGCEAGASNLPSERPNPARAPSAWGPLSVGVRAQAWTPSLGMAALLMFGSRGT